MTRDPRKAAGKMCFAFDCRRTDRLHGIAWRCRNGHGGTLRYCGDHIEGTQALAMLTPAVLIDGLDFGTPVCKECHLPLTPVLEGS